MMQKRNMAGNECSLLGFGCMRFPTKGGKIDEQKAAQMFDEAMKAFFSFADRPALAAKWVEKIYLEYFGKNGRRSFW